MNEEKILFSTKEMLVCVKQERGSYYFTVAEQEIRGPYVDEVEAYQEAMREMAQYFEALYTTQEEIRQKMLAILTPIENLLNGFRLKDPLEPLNDD